MRIVVSTMKFKILIIFLLALPLIVAETSGGNLMAKQNDCISLPQECADCTYVTLTTITLPNLNKTSIQTGMDKDGTSFSYDYCGTSLIGTYSYCTLGDVGGTDTVACNDFEITPSGFQGTLGFYFIILAILGGIVLMGFSIREAWFVVLGGLGFIMLGIYSINYGIAGFRDMFMTWAIGLFEIGVGAILSVGSAIQKMDYD